MARGRSGDPLGRAIASTVVTVGSNGSYATLQEAIDFARGPSTIVRVEAGTYDSFVIDGFSGVDIHVVGEGNGPVFIDASSQPVTVRNTGSASIVEICDLVVHGGASHAALSVSGCLGPVVLDEIQVHGGPSQPGIRVTESAVVALQSSEVEGTPGLEATRSANVYVSRGSLDEIDLSLSSTAKLCQLDADETADASSSFVHYEGVMPAIDCDRFQRLGQAFELEIATEPGAFWLLLLSPSFLPFDAQADRTALGIQNILARGISHPTTGRSPTTLLLPPDASRIGRSIPLQLATVDRTGRSALRYSNLRTVIALP